MANLTSGISITHRFSKKCSFAENAGQVHAKIQKALKRTRWFVLQFLAELPPTLLDGVLLNMHHCYENPFLERVGRTMGYGGDKTRDLGITNLTVLDIPTVYGAYKLEKIVFVPPAVSYSHNIIGVSTFRDEMTISFHYMKDKETESRDFFDRAVQNLVRNIF